MFKNVTLSASLCFFLIFIGNAQTSTNLGANSGLQGDNNTFIGFRSGQITTGQQNSFFGALSGRFNVSGERNTFIGFNSGRNNNDGNGNSFLGFSAGWGNESGLNNSYLGANTGRSSTSGNNNVFLGSSAGQTMTNGNRNVYLGTSAGRDAMGSGNVFIGYRAGDTETGNNILLIDNNNTDEIPLIYGNFSSGQLGINTANVPTGTILAVAGDALVDGTLTTNGKISIGTNVADPGYDFSVKGKIHVQEVKVDLLGAIAPDYVFFEDYNLSTLQEVEDFITQEGHLPNIPSAEEMKENGVHLKEMNLKLLEKIEELTLYIIAQDKTIKKQKVKVDTLEKRLQKVESILKED